MLFKLGGKETEQIKVSPEKIISHTRGRPQDEYYASSVET